MNGPGYSTIKDKRPPRYYRTLLEVQLHIPGHKKFYENPGEMQTDLEVCLVRYISRRPHQELNMKGRTAAQAFPEGLPNNSKGGSTKAL